MKYLDFRWIIINDQGLTQMITLPKQIAQYLLLCRVISFYAFMPYQAKDIQKIFTCVREF